MVYEPRDYRYNSDKKEKRKNSRIVSNDKKAIVPYKLK